MSRELHDEWAWTQVEAMADGSLSGTSLARMEDAMRRDTRLAGAVTRAQAVHRALRRKERVRMPPGFAQRLWSIPHTARHSQWRRKPAWALMGASNFAGAAAAIAIAAIALSTVREITPLPRPTPEADAVRDFQIALHYLGKSVSVANNEVGAALDEGFTVALNATRDSIQMQ